MKQLRASELADWLANPGQPKPRLLDVREPWEFALCQIPGSENRPTQTIPTHHQDLDPDAPVVCICHHGMRSHQVGLFLERQGFGEVYNLAGGVDAWATSVDPTMARY
jgi:rhodanese-related sulfurtransferase